MGLDAVYFQPWRGTEYDQNGFRSRKVLIVGESHFTVWDGVDSRHLMTRKFTQKCVQDAINEVPNISRYWGAVRNRLGGDEYRSAPAKFWNKVAFYNFIQSPVIGGPGARPTLQQWTAAGPILEHVLSELRPDRVIFTGYKLWEHVLPRSEKFPDLKRNGETRGIPLESFNLPDGKRIFATRTAHPRSSQFGWWLTPLLHEFVVRDWDQVHPRRLPVQ